MKVMLRRLIITIFALVYWAKEARSENLVSNSGFESASLEGWKISDRDIQICKVGMSDGCPDITGSPSYVRMGRGSSSKLWREITLTYNGTIVISGLVGRFPADTSDEFMLTVDFAGIHKTLFTQDNITNLTHFQIPCGEISNGTKTLSFSLEYSQYVQSETYIVLDDIKVDVEYQVYNSDIFVIGFAIIIMLISACIVIYYKGKCHFSKCCSCRSNKYTEEVDLDDCFLVSQKFTSDSSSNDSLSSDSSSNEFPLDKPSSNEFPLDKPSSNEFPPDKPLSNEFPPDKPSSNE